MEYDFFYGWVTYVLLYVLGDTHDQDSLHVKITNRD